METRYRLIKILRTCKPMFNMIEDYVVGVETDFESVVDALLAAGVGFYEEKDMEIKVLRKKLENLKSELRLRYGASQDLENIFEQCEAEAKK